ncbi:MAG TPA: nucleoside-diphosphate kinase [Thermoguttaceae bacterium]|nr:nucleoside-diphosphate kinase [Thermoguttaceae bacterium]
MDDGRLEQTLVLIKPDALRLSLTGYLFSQLSEFHTGLRFAALKVVHVTRTLAEVHYAEHKGKPFYEPLLGYIMGREHYPTEPHKRRVIAVVYSGVGAVAKIREIAGPTDPHVARDRAPGTIRALGTLVPVKDAGGNTVDYRMDNLIHASATVEEAEREIKLWFRPDDIMPYMRGWPAERCREHYYLEDGQLSTTYRPGSTCLLAPGGLAWTTDLDALGAISRGEVPPCPLNAVVTKYLVNVEQDS